MYGNLYLKNHLGVCPDEEARLSGVTRLWWNSDAYVALVRLLDGCLYLYMEGSKMKKVVKFGGSSLADASQFKKVKDIVTAEESRVYVVCSAPGKRFSGDNKVTDLLLMTYQLASHDLSYDEVFDQIVERFQAINEELDLGIALDFLFNDIKMNIENGASQDYLVSRGEYINGILLAKYLDYEFIDAAEVIKFDEYGRLDSELTEDLLSKKLEEVGRAVVPGFFGANGNGEIITFTRGGSDITGSIVANAGDVDLYENWTDVPGFLVADPNIVPGAEPMSKVTHRELRELSYMGAPVIHEEAIFPIKEKGIKIHIRNTNSAEDPGTLIVNEEPENITKGTITGIAGKKGFSVISLEKAWMNSEVGFLRKVITVFESNDINVEHIPSSVDSVSVVVSNEELKGKEKKLVDELQIYCNPDEIKFESGKALITIVGNGMASVKGMSGKIFTSLANHDVNVSLITQGASEISIIIGVEEEDFEKAILGIYKAFK